MAHTNREGQMSYVCNRDYTYTVPYARTERPREPPDTRRTFTRTNREMRTLARQGIDRGVGPKLGKLAFSFCTSRRALPRDHTGDNVVSSARNEMSAFHPNDSQCSFFHLHLFISDSSCPTDVPTVGGERCRTRHISAHLVSPTCADPRPYAKICLVSCSAASRLLRPSRRQCWRRTSTRWPVRPTLQMGATIRELRDRGAAPSRTRRRSPRPMKLVAAAKVRRAQEAVLRLAPLLGDARAHPRWPAPAPQD